MCQSRAVAWLQRDPRTGHATEYSVADYIKPALGAHRLSASSYADLCRRLQTDGDRMQPSENTERHVRHGLLSAQVREAQRLIASLEDAIARLLGDLRSSGATWDDIGATLGTTKQSAHSKYAAVLRKKGY